MMYDWKAIGNRIREVRNEKGLTQAKICEELRVGRNTVSEWENDKSKPQLEDLLGLCNLFNCELGYLLCEYDTPFKAHTDVAQQTQLSKKSVENIMDLKDKHKKLFGNGKNTLDVLLSDNAFIELLRNIEEYKQLKAKNIDKNMIDAKAFMLCKDFINTIDNM